MQIGALSLVDQFLVEELHQCRPRVHPLSFGRRRQPIIWR